MTTVNSTASNLQDVPGEGKECSKSILADVPEEGRDQQEEQSSLNKVGSYVAKHAINQASSAADPDPGSGIRGLFDPWIPDPKPIYLRA